MFAAYSPNRLERIFPLLDGLEGALEMMHIDVYLMTKGYSRKSLQALPEKQRKRLMTEASIYASSRMAEIEMRAKLLRVLHGGE